MAFLIVPTKTKLVQIEMLGREFYTEAEIESIRLSDKFYSWSSLGYYETTQVLNIVDIPAEETCNTPNRGEDEYPYTWEELFCDWLGKER